MIEVWTEKYRPQSLEEIQGQSNITNRLRAFVKAQNFPHLLFAGRQESEKQQQLWL